jgi:hypothetical protein
MAVVIAHPVVVFIDEPSVSVIKSRTSQQSRTAAANRRKPAPSRQAVPSTCMIDRFQVNLCATGSQRAVNGRAARLNPLEEWVSESHGWQGSATSSGFPAKGL